MFHFSAHFLQKIETIDPKIWFSQFLLEMNFQRDFQSNWRLCLQVIGALDIWPRLYWKIVQQSYFKNTTKCPPNALHLGKNDFFGVRNTWVYFSQIRQNHYPCIFNAKKVIFDYLDHLMNIPLYFIEVFTLLDEDTKIGVWTQNFI